MGSVTRRILAVHQGSELFGSDRMFLESVRGFRDAGADVLVVLPHDGPLVPLLRAAGARVAILPLFVLRKRLLRPSGWGELMRDGLAGAGTMLRALRGRPDAVYISTITLPQAAVLARLCSRARVVVHVHEAERVGRLAAAILRLPLHAAHSIVFNSRFSRRVAIGRSAALRRRSRVIYNGVEPPSRVTAPRETVHGPLRVLYVGRLSERKGPDLVLQAAARLADNGQAVSVRLVGSVFPGYEAYEERLRDAAAHLPPLATAAFTGFTADVSDHLSWSDVVVVPSRAEEPFGNTVVEGVLAHRPVIAADQGGIREAGRGYPTVHLIPSDDAEVLADTISAVEAEWRAESTLTPGSARLAERRHSPSLYQDAVAATVVGSPR